MVKPIPPPEINRRAKTPPHQQVSDWLEARIKAGEFNPPGEVPLPSELELVELLGIARDTARRAFARLRDAGLIETVATRGSFTLERWPRRRAPRKLGPGELDLGQ